ncbi:hypothetical protein sos41_08290 [Alphaproteobacteria bacterium SO-S41]|nr:hypothetical protein sos41_08290 [Alphaproteobacteria bacterium SO-S41]
MLRMLIAATLLAGLAFAEDERFSLNDYKERVDATIAACSADPNGSECRVNQMSVLPSTVEALSMIGYNGSYDKHAALLRDFASYPVPQVATAAIYALARLGARHEDLPVIREALLSDVPALRRAALGALKGLADPQAQVLFARGAPNPDYMPSGSSYVHNPLPFDPATVGVTWPKEPRYLFFRDRRSSGTYTFTTSQDVASTVALFETQAGAKAMGLGDITARFGGDHADLLREWQAQNETEGAIQAIVLKDQATPTRDAPVLIALVFEDYALGKTGFALLRLPGAPFPAPPTPPVAKPELTAPDDGKEWFSAGVFTPKAEAAADDVDAWREVVFEATPEAAQDYLAKFPAGAYRAEAEAMTTAPVLDASADVYAETQPIAIAWRNMPADREIAIRLDANTDGQPSFFDTRASETPIIDKAAGDATLTSSYPLDPGVYSVRAVDRDGVVVAETQVRIALAEATLTLTATSFAPGAPIEIIYADMAGDKRDFISIAKAGATDNDYGSPWLYTNGTATGSLTLQAPSTPGEYEVRAYYREERKVRARVKITVGGAAAPAATPAPANPEAPPAPTAATGPAALTLTATSFPTNAVIEIKFANFSGSPNDYISLAKPGSANTEYIVYQRTGGSVAGTLTLKAPAEPGAYELRAFFNEDESVVRATVPITVTAPEGVPLATLALEKQVYAPGETIGITFDNMSGSNVDYVAVAEVGARYSSYVSYVYTKGAKSGRAELKAPTKPGAYEIRAFYNEDESILRASVPLTVANPP